MAHQDQHAAHAGHVGFKDYLIGFVLSVILTVIPFGLVMHPEVLGLSRGMTLIALVLFGLAQVLVHLVYFLHMKTDAEGRWNVISMLFTVVIIALVVGLSVWIMWSMHYHMMIN